MSGDVVGKRDYALLTLFVTTGMRRRTEGFASNTHFEVYRDIFKVIIARDDALPGLGHFVFSTPESGARALRRGFARAGIEHAAGIRLRVEVKGI